MLLDINNLVVGYGMITALHGVSLRVEPGEVVTLIGSNGAGKTTLLRTISGLLRPRAGTIVFQGKYPLHTYPPHQIVRVGVSHSPEGRQVFPNLTVRENLFLGAYQQRSRSQILADMDRCMHLFPILRERRDQKAGTLSGGEQQMLAMARALMARPTLLLLDEPSLGLAPLIVRKIFDIIRDISAAGTTIFLVEQNAHMALSVATRGYVLQTGRIIKEAPARELLADPAVQAAYLGG
ncbi:MAG: ABC transporter ATP-binding protein [Tepidisphaerales bacterium]